MRAGRPWWVGVIAVWAVGPGVCEAVHLRGQVVHVGFPGSSQEQFSQPGDRYRIGCWTPVLVDLTNDDGDQFEGWIEVRQPDRDGDLVVARQEVAIRGARRFFLYVPGGAGADDTYVSSLGREGSLPFTVRVFDNDGKLAELHDDKGEPVTELPPWTQVFPVRSEDLVILDISTQGVSQLAFLKKNERLSRELVFTRSSASDLPGTAAGLEMADVIIWDGADPSSLDVSQRDALLEWTRRGGWLILGVSRNWELVTKSRFGELLPGKLTGTEISTDAKPAQPLYPEGMVTPEIRNRPLDPPLTYCPFTRASLVADARPVVPDLPADDEQILAARRPCGRGMIVLVPAELRELMGHARQSDRFFLDIMALQTGRSPDDSRNTGFGGRISGADVFTPVADQIAFQTTSGFYFAFAFAFVIAYILVATAGSWAWLRHRAAVRQSWPAFAAVAMVASGVSLGAVQLVRVIGQGVHELSIVDTRAGSFEGAATCYFGLKTATHTEVDLCVPMNWLKPDEAPEQRAWLRPLSPQGGWVQEQVFAASRKYSAVAPIGELRGVPIRATLKQFESVWQGDLNGRLMANLRAAGDRSPELNPASWLDNQFGVPLYHCYLFVKRGRQIAAYPIGELPAGSRVNWGVYLDRLKQREQEGESPRTAIERARDPDAEGRQWEPYQVRDLHGRWLESLMAIANRPRTDAEREERERLQSLRLREPDFVRALLLLTTFEEIDFQQSGGWEITRSQGQRLDRSALLRDDMALFVGFSEGPGPTRLCRRKPGGGPGDWESVASSECTVMYRVAVPVAR